MADLTDVATALVGILAAAVYPNGTGQAPAGGVQAKIYQGWPDPAQLKTDLAKHIAHISVWPTAKTKITTRHNPEWQQIIAPAPTLVATVGAVGKTITLTGTVSVPQAVAIVIDGKDYAYGVQATDTLATIAASLAALVSNDQAATVAAGVITIPNAHSIGAHVVANGTSAAEVARELRVFTVSIWASCFDEREPLARVVTPALASLTHLTLADNTGSTVDYAGSRQIDIEQRQGIFRREIDLAIEYATIATRTDTTVGLVLLHRTVAAGTGVTVAGDTVIGNAIAVVGAAPTGITWDAATTWDGATYWN